MTISFSVSPNVPKSTEVEAVFALTENNSQKSSNKKSNSQKSNSQKSSSQKSSADTTSSGFTLLSTHISTGRLTEADTLLKSRGFKAKKGTVELISGPGNKIVAVVGLGEEINLEAIRSSAAALARSVKRHSSIACHVHSIVHSITARDITARGNTTQSKATTKLKLPKLKLSDWGRVFAEGASLGSYQYSEFKSEPDPSSLRKITLITDSSAADRRELKAGTTEGTILAKAVNFARDLVNEPGGSLTPQNMADKAKKMAETSGLKAQVWGMKEIKREKLGGLLGVNRGSQCSPRFVKLEWKPAGKPSKSIALVGKGVTFDSGGLSLKTATGMRNMKYDMSGAAAVLGAMSAVAELKPKCKVTAYVPMTDNMTGGDATRVGDVLHIRNQKTVEVLNTDAEGRLILADALCLAVEDSPDAIVDLATLTGACVVALGNGYAGILGNDEDWISTVMGASEKSGERLWQLPLPSDYRSQLDSPIADIANIGSGNGGTITAALFLAEFVPEEIPWAHLDIAGTAFSDKVSGVNIKGGTGFGVRTLLQLIQDC